jgi:DNA-binding NarL/FixJ family response regulator
MSVDERNGVGVKLLIVDDHTAVRNAMRSLAIAAGIAIAGEANVFGAAAMARERNADVVLLGINSSLIRGLDALSQIKEVRPDLPILVYALDDSPFAVAKARERGAHGYFAKGRDEPMLVEAIQRVAVGEEIRNVKERDADQP